MGPALEVTDIFRRHGEAFRQAYAGHLGRVERRVMGAITACRTAVLGGHVEQCDDCGTTRIAYNSCRNRHCPKCQGAARAQWLAEWQAKLLPVPYFHVVFTLPAPAREIAFQNKAVVLSHPIPLRGGDAHHHRGRPQASRCPARRDRHPPYLGPDSAIPSACPLCRAWWWTFARRHTMGRLPAWLLPAGPRPLPAIPPPVSARAASCLRGWPVRLFLVISPISPIRPCSPSGSISSDGPTGSSTPSRHSADPNRCWLISAAIRIASPSPTAD